MPLFKHAKYRAGQISGTIKLKGISYRLVLSHKAITDDGRWHAACNDYGIVCKADTRLAADNGLAAKLGLRAPSVPAAPKLVVSAPFVPNSITHQPASEFRGKEYAPRSYVSGPELHKVCQFLKELVISEAIPSGAIRWIAANGKKRAKWEIGAELLPEFWALVHGDLKGQQIRVLDRTRPDTGPITITV